MMASDVPACVHQQPATQDFNSGVFGAEYGRWLTYDEVAPYYERLSYTVLLVQDYTSLQISDLFMPGRLGYHQRQWCSYYAVPHPEAVTPVVYWRSTLTVRSGETGPVLCAVRVQKTGFYWWEYFVLPQDLNNFKKCKKNNPKSTILYHQTAP